MASCAPIGNRRWSGSVHHSRRVSCFGGRPIANRPQDAILPHETMTPQLNDPEHIAISKSKGIEIDWKDGHHSSFGVEYLRDWCPCASCAGTHGTEPRPKTTEQPAKPSSPFQMYKPRERMVDIEPVGNY